MTVHYLPSTTWQVAGEHTGAKNQLQSGMRKPIQVLNIIMCKHNVYTKIHHISYIRGGGETLTDFLLTISANRTRGRKKNIKR